MAKDKKKGFFSWLGFGRKSEEETQQPDVEHKNDVAHNAKQDEAARLEAERQHQVEEDAIKAAEDAERQHQAHLDAMRIAAEKAEQERQAAADARIAEEKAAREVLEAQALRKIEEEAERQYQIEQAAIKAAEEAAERQHQAELEAIKDAEEKAEREYQAAEAARLAEEKAETERQEAEAARLAEEEAERQRQAELAAIKATEEKAERERQEAEAARLAEEEAERQRQAELAAIKAAEEKAERERQEAEAARLAEEEAERQRQAELAAIKAAEEKAERERQEAEAARLAEEEAERQRQAELAAIKVAEEKAERERQEAEAARLAEEEAQRQAEEAANAQLIEQEKPKKEGFFSRLKKGLLKTRQNLGSGFLGLFKGKKIDDDLFDELEEQLLIADVGVETTRKIIDNLTHHASRKELKDAEALYGKLREEMSDILSTVDKPLVIEGKKPYVILMVGVNGVGKTTTIGKLARQYQSEGKSVMLAAGDTFRAAAVEQLQVWGERNKISVVAQHTGADPASVIYDAIQSAQAKGADVLIADTAGRLQNKAHLMEELKKIVRVMKKLDESAPHEIMLTLDASTGQNAVSQAKIFNDAVGLTGITLTKLDGTAKGGVIFSIADQFGIPIRYIGIGEGIEDLRPFKADDFIEALFAREE
ncbi:signal recognition particle-docking protein FtsY [Providencia alcalifaciens]|uniref:signal recognition particle-docking protein FtsY n=1 Tax=Providencia alcalifaciens TaxID=126385 RepID=UPI001CC513CB|nr:signal recognition particle-docking protein FtsY [Providencia alcalifaciens]CAG9428004.1 Signal recognition particle receptor FtsY [Providencia alcalifaciens]CAG9431739.1 Signal recognition particle receptor FtsY [Providencia alcalifaciens]CAG9431920.1 Signal recognition particle receptor FtsY [Providencia alcalifaciens]CAG9432856.1 Signal recognition particle receptor FtsY [Providencia alcalifaciens]CAG9433106.1 Signal recognition particle receptor FtsY [Providencia alcalifaciens]